MHAYMSKTCRKWLKMDRKGGPKRSKMIDLWAKNAFFRCRMARLGHRNTKLNFEKNVEKCRFLTLCCLCGRPYRRAWRTARQGMLQGPFYPQNTILSTHSWCKNDLSHFIDPTIGGFGHLISFVNVLGFVQYRLFDFMRFWPIYMHACRTCRKWLKMDRKGVQNGRKWSICGLKMRFSGAEWPN